MGLLSPFLCQVDISSLPQNTKEYYQLLGSLLSYTSYLQEGGTEPIGFLAQLRKITQHT